MSRKLRNAFSNSDPENWTLINILSIIHIIIIIIFIIINIVLLSWYISPSLVVVVKCNGKYDPYIWSCLCGTKSIYLPPPSPHWWDGWEGEAGDREISAELSVWHEWCWWWPVLGVMLFLEPGDGLCPGGPCQGRCSQPSWAELGLPSDREKSIRNTTRATQPGQGRGGKYL